MMARVVAILVLAMPLAGCIDGETAAAAPKSPSTLAPAAEPNVTADLGAITGLIVNEEQVPVSNADINLVGTLFETTSDEAGAFTLNGLEPGPYGLVVTRVGFEQEGRKVEVVAGEVKRVDMVLTGIVILEPHYLTLSKVAYFSAGWLYFTHALWTLGVNNSDVNRLFCDPCRFTQFHPMGSDAVMTETLWRSGGGSPVLNKDVWIQYQVNVTADEPTGKTVITGYWTDRKSVKWSSKEALGKFDKHDLWVQAGLATVNVDHRVETFTSLAFDGGFPEGFTALPPK